MIEDEKIDNIDDLRIIEPIAFVRSHTRMFLGVDDIQESRLAQSIVTGAMTLTHKIVVTCRYAGWSIIAAEEDWLSLAHNPRGRSVFTEVVPFPEDGVNSCHPEVLLRAFACDLVTASEAGWATICGSPMDSVARTWVAAHLPVWRRLIAFRMDGADAKEKN